MIRLVSLLLLITQHGLILSLFLCCKCVILSSLLWLTEHKHQKLMLTSFKQNFSNTNKNKQDKAKTTFGKFTTAINITKQMKVTEN